MFEEISSTFTEREISAGSRVVIEPLLALNYKLLWPRPRQFSLASRRNESWGAHSNPTGHSSCPDVS